MSMLKNSAFDEFVKNQQANAHSDVNWNAVRDEWLRRLDELYSQIREFLKKYIDAGERRKHWLLHCPTTHAQDRPETG
jgi:hypothetical protein